MIKAAKRAIYAILSSADVTDEELLSAIVGAEGLINSRPLIYQSANPKDNIPLTPNHFLHGQVGGTVCSRQRRYYCIQPQEEMETGTGVSQTFLARMDARISSRIEPSQEVVS